jgi:hypothetical protein
MVFSVLSGLCILSRLLTRGEQRELREERNGRAQPTFDSKDPRPEKSSVDSHDGYVKMGRVRFVVSSNPDSSGRRASSTARIVMFYILGRPRNLNW